MSCFICRLRTEEHFQLQFEKACNASVNLQCITFSKAYDNVFEYFIKIFFIIFIMVLLLLALNDFGMKIVYWLLISILDKSMTNEKQTLLIWVIILSKLTNHERINLFGYSQFNSATQNYQKDSMKSMYNLTDRTITIAFYSHL